MRDFCHLVLIPREVCRGRFGSLHFRSPHIHGCGGGANRPAHRDGILSFKAGFWMSALLTLMAVMVQTALSMPISILDHTLIQLHKAPLNLAEQPVVIGIVNCIAFGSAIVIGVVLNRVPFHRAFPPA